MTTPLSLQDKVIVITGAAQGIGAATAELCAERGAAVVLVDFNKEKGEAAAAKIRETGAVADFVATDVRQDADVKAVFDFVQQKHGRLDGLVCAAGVLLGPWLQPEEFPLEDFEKTLDVNIKGVFLCSKYASALLESAAGVMVVVASGAGVKGGSSSLAYGASKGGANGLGMTLEGHLGKRGVRVNVICPGNIITDMKMSVDIARAQQEGRSVEEEYERAKREYGLPPGVAKIIAFMISDEADYLRGTLFTR
ncbi:MAG: SDR family oxidoreductase [Anaerolineae bacterium]|nr:SDR family oxidoreductase [Anaerolineae bacterium]